MIAKNAKLFCCEDLSSIENYDKAIADTTQTWHCHHRLETILNLSRKDLLKMGLYFRRPAGELIFLTQSRHMSIHHLGKTAWNAGKHYKLSEETKSKIAETRKYNKENGIKTKIGQLKQQRNEKIFKMIEDGVKYADIAAAFNMSLASIKKFGQALKHNKEQEKKNA